MKVSLNNLRSAMITQTQKPIASSGWSKSQHFWTSVILFVISICCICAFLSPTLIIFTPFLALAWVGWVDRLLFAEYHKAKEAAEAARAIALGQEQARKKAEDDARQAAALRQSAEEAERRNEAAMAAAAKATQEAARVEAERRALVESLEGLFGLGPCAFEDIVTEMFQRLGYEASRTAYSNDGGYDIRIVKNGHAEIVECKRYAAGNLVGRPTLQRFRSAMLDQGVTSGYFITTSGYSKQAMAYPQSISDLTMILIDGARLVEMMKQSYAQKPSSAGFPNAGKTASTARPTNPKTASAPPSGALEYANWAREQLDEEIRLARGRGYR